MEYQTLYRTWRPKLFRDIVGQEPIVTTLVNQILSGRIAHAYLFCGSRGTGKTSTAKVFARAINCSDPSTGAEPCGKCASCVQLQNENSMDVIEIDAASNNGVDEIRDLRDKVKYPPSVGKYKVYIIDEVHMLSAGAFNALLKTLEEPPKHAVFILATTEPQKLPATILSRCQRFDFRRFSAQVIVRRLREALPSAQKQIEESALYDIARASEGGMRDAWNLLEMCLAYENGGGVVDEKLVREVLGTSDRSFLFGFVDAILRGDAGEALRGIDQAMRDGRDGAVFAREIAAHLRALLLAQAVDEGLEDLLDITREDAQRYVEQARTAPPEKLRRAMELFVASDADMRYAAQPRTVLELCVIKSCHPERERSIEALEQRIAELEQALSGGAVVVEKAPEKAPPKEKKAAPAKEKAPETPAGTQKSAAAGKEMWDQAVKAIAENDKAIYPLLVNIVYTGVKDDLVLLEMPKKWKMYMTILQTDAKKAILEKRLSEAFGKPMHVQLAMEGDKAAPKPASTRRRLEEIFDAFDRENVSVEDEDQP